MDTFIETQLFSESAQFLSDDELRAAQIAIRARGRGKSGGARIIYLDNTERCGQVWLLLAYDKSVADDISAAGRKALAALVIDVKRSPCIANPALQLPN